MSKPDSIFLLSEDGSLKALENQGYVTEDRLQALLAEHPALLAGGQINEADPRRWLLVSREVAIPSDEERGSRWSVDHLFLDQDGVPTLVEVKRSTDTRIRREVVGQLLEYAANALTYWPPGFIRERFEKACDVLGSRPEEVIRAFLAAESSAEDFWDRVKTNLQAGKVRLLFVSDDISSELRQIVEFLNSQMNPAEVLAVEIKKYGGDGVSTLVPRVLGQTMAAERLKGPRRGEKKWDEASFFEELAKNVGPNEVEAARRILSWSQQKSFFIWWGEGSRSGSFIPVSVAETYRHQLFAVWTGGTVEIYFYWYKYKPQFADPNVRLEMARRLSQIPGITLGEEHIGKRPNIPLSTLVPLNAWEAFKSVFDWFLEVAWGSGGEKPDFS